MAGRPAAGGSGVVIGMGVAIGIAVIALVLLVVLWTNQEELRSEASRATQELQQVGSPRAFAAWYDKASTSMPAAKLMQNELEALSKAVSPTVAELAPGITQQITRNELDPLWTRMENDKYLDDPTVVVRRSLVEGLTGLYEAFSRKHQRLQQAENQVKELEAQNDALVAENSELRTSFEETATQMRDKLASIENEWNEFREAKVSEFAAIEQKTQERDAEAAKQRQELREQLESFTSDLDKKEDRVRELQEKLREFQIQPQARMAARQADGRIVRAEPGERSLYIDLGSDDHLTLGLRFAVYPPEGGIPSSGEAKAAIEVFSIGRDVSECRVVWMDRVNPILEGDLVANPIYDQKRRLNFKVIGAFDFDYDGRDDPNGAESVKAVITDAGGTIVDALSSRTDFLIVGARPLVRELEASSDEDAITIHREQTRELEEYNAVLAEAMALSIPILTQETFLNFMGRER